MKTVQKQTGSAHVVIIIVLVVVVIGLLGFVFWQNFIANDKDTSTAPKTSQVVNEDTKKEPVEETGTIVGSLTYPSEQIPANLEVHAVNLDTNKEYTTTDQLKGSQYQYGIGYRINVPVGHYNVYGILSDMPETRAYYDQVIVCGIKASCKDTTKVEVIVEANKDTADATVGDWWAQ